MTPEPPEESSVNEGVPPPLNDPGAHAPPADVDYELIRLIGRGGYGDVWLVRDAAGNYRACKVVYRESFRQERPYEREYQGIRKFEPVSRASESQIKILHVGRREALGYFFYIMELADDVQTGQAIHPDHYVPRTLRSELEQKKTLAADECIQIGLWLSEALENLHGHGLIHRDIKPANLIFVNGRPKLADIGLVTDLEVTVSYVGTEGYIPPEGPTSPQADVYGLGKVLYEISTGKDRLEYPELPANFAGLPDWEKRLELNAIVTRACEAEASRRYASARELHADLAALARGTSVRRRRAVQRRWSLAMRSGLVLAALALVAVGLVWLAKHPFHDEPGPSAAVESLKIPVPDAAQLAQSESKIRAVWHDQLAGGTAAGKKQAAAELFNRSSSESDPAMELASLRVAAQLELELADFSRAMEICDRLAARFQMNILPVKTALLGQADPFARTGRNKADLANVCVATGFQAIAADDYASAQTIAQLAATAAHHTGNPSLTRLAESLAAETARCAADFERVKIMAAMLRDNPGDPAANLAMGKFVCFVKNDWAQGLPLMARGGDDSLKPVLNEEINGQLNTPAEQIALGNSWWDLAGSAPDDTKVFYQQRARYWYLKGIAGVREPDQSRDRQDLAERVKAVPTEAAAVHIVSRVGGTEYIDIYSDETQWRSSRRGAVGNQINQVNLGDFSASELQVIKNTGATWLMPGTVDFTSARLDRDRKPGRHNQAALAIFDDHVRVTLAHPREGSAALEVTVLFGGPP